MVGARLITRVFDLVTMMVMARILLPADFGVVAIAMTAVAIVEAVLELPVNQALLLRPDITASQYDTAFTLSLMRSLLLAAILIAAAWPFAYFYQDSRIILLVCLLSLAPAARGLQSPRLAKFQKELSFWRDFTIELVGKVVGFTTGVTIAVTTGSYWALAAATIAYPVTMAIASFCLAPYRPRFSLREAPMFMGFLGWFSAAQMVSAVNWQLERLLLGKLQPAARFGLFTTANDVASIPMLALFGPILRPLLASFSHLADQQPALVARYQKASAAILLIGIPLLVGESLVAEPLILLMLGEKWRAAAPLLRWLAISLVPSLFALPAIPLMMTLGRTQWVLRRNLIEFAVKFPIVIVCGMRYGIPGVIFARLVSETVTAVFCVHMVRRMIGLSVRDQATASWRAVAGTLVMTVAILLCQYAFPIEPLASFAQGLQLATTVAGGVLIYAATVTTLWVSAGRPAGLETVALDLVSSVITRTTSRPLLRRALYAHRKDT